MSLILSVILITSAISIVDAKSDIESKDFVYSSIDGKARLDGQFNTGNHVVSGKITFSDHPAIFITEGRYFPKTKNSGYILFRIYNAGIKNDVGLYWFGTYDQNSWTLKYGKVEMKGPVITPIH